MIKTTLALMGLTLSLTTHAATITLNPIEAGTTYDQDGNGYFEYANGGTGQNLVVRNFVEYGSVNFEDRGFAEFSFAGIPDTSIVNSMQLTFSLISVTSNTGRVVDIVGYEGGGFNYVGNLDTSGEPSLASFDSWSLGLGTHTIDLNFNNNDLTALLINDSLGLLFQGSLTTNAVIRNNLSLIVDYTVVPVPAAIWLFSSGLIGLAGFLRFRKT